MPARHPFTVLLSCLTVFVAFGMTGSASSQDCGLDSILEYSAAHPPLPSVPVSDDAVASRNVEVVVAPRLHASEGIAPAISQYLEDVRQQGITPFLTTTSFSNPSELRQHLADRNAQEGLQGALLVGDLPIEYFETEARENYIYGKFPTDLYYMDLDGDWSDADGDGLLDTHEGDVAPEIWLGRISTANLVTSLTPQRTEEGMVESYFARNHEYRTGQLHVEPKALGFVDDDWVDKGEDWTRYMGNTVDGEVVYVGDPDETTVANYREYLSLEWEHVLLASHSSYYAHRMGRDLFLTREVAEIDPKILFYNLFACSAARYDEPSYLGGEYVFGTTSSLLAVGSTKVGAMLEFRDYFDRLGAGDTFGAAYKHWWDRRAGGGFSYFETYWHYGMTMLGDPLLVTQRHVIPEPAGWLGLITGIGLISVVRSRIRRRREALLLQISECT